ncbi:MAG TPA: helix-hairpin-helix domain-containing protein [Candidatus Dormibacteraeota bacterium]|jgi:DNA polymerase (family 10)|nr:helix-hairpin-helix domain-containing protein [Candidatus Dormibacteraeota bacterium]
MRNDQYSSLLNRIADLLEIRGEVFFKIRSYREAARQIDELAEPIDTLMAEGRLSQVHGIGKAIADKLAEYGQAGRSEYLERIELEVPPGLLDFLRIPGLGPRTAKDIYDATGATTLDDLQRALDDGRIRQVPRIKAKTEENIRKGLLALRGRGEGPRTLLHVAMATAQRFVAALERLPEVERIAPAGSLRRRAESIGDLDLVVAARAAAPVMAAFCELPEAAEVLARGETKSSIRTPEGVQVDLRVVAPEHFGAALVYFTGSKAHNVKMRALALRQGLTLNEYGLARLAPEDDPAADADGAGDGAIPAVAATAEAPAATAEAPAARAEPAAAAPEPGGVTVGGKRSRAVVASPEELPSATEEEVYAALGLAWVAPVLREDRGEIALAAEKRLPRLLDLADVRGDLHSHSTQSDGRNTIEEMLEAAAQRGYAYLAITDHSRSAGIITGIEGARYREQIERVREAGARVEARHPGFRTLAGVEANILPDGSLDVPDEILADLDVVVASVHSNFNLSREDQTARICRAALSPNVDILGHPTGRKIEHRPPYDVDLEEVFKAALAGGTAVEINANPHRLDLGDVFARRARDLGLKLAIGSDSHHTRELDHMEFGVYVAQRAWLQPDDVLNCWDAGRLLAHLGRS